VDDSPDLDLREDASGNPVVCGAHIVDISSPEQASAVAVCCCSVLLQCAAILSGVWEV
jgi:hypothetical protein